MIHLLTSQDGLRTIRIDAITGIFVSDGYLCVQRDIHVTDLYGEFKSDEKAVEVMKEIWYAIDVGISYTVPKEEEEQCTEVK